ncbi:MAG: SDR family oxidoreductase [Actinomycetia bacterium]|nr:SDR family oxidoreductase [Actinomycetes bacterium]
MSRPGSVCSVLAGVEVAKRLIRRGYRVLAVDRTQELSDLAANALGGESIPVPCDLSVAVETTDLCQRITTEWPQDLEVLVCNAGVTVPADVVDHTPGEIDRQLDVTLRSSMHLINAALGVFLPRNRGHVMATVSRGGICPLPGSAPSLAANAGLRAFLAALNCEVAGTGVHVSGIYPTAVNTPMLEGEARLGSALNFLSRVLTVNEVADAYERVLDKPKLELYVPNHESLSARAALWTPSLIRRVIPLLQSHRRARARQVPENPLPKWRPIPNRSTPRDGHHSLDSRASGVFR